MTHAGLNPIHSMTALDEYGQTCTVRVASEVPLTLIVNNEEIVTLVTLGAFPEVLAMGYLRNQGLVKNLSEIKSVEVNWERGIVQIDTFKNFKTKKTNFLATTTTCGQGAKLSTSKLPNLHFSEVKLKQSVIYAILQGLASYSEIHRRTGGVHSCALCQNTDILAFVEDVGRHNAVDTLAGLMWLHHWSGPGKIFYTTGRLTSEMVMKVIHAEIPVLLSRSGVTQRSVEIAQQLGVILIAHAKEKHFLVFSGEKNIFFDACP